jgi:RNA-directed DNA polymerase
LCKRHIGATPEELINKLNPVLRGWANYHRHVICAETFGKVDSFVWGRVYRWCKRRHPDKTGRWIAKRYFLSKERKGWRFTDPNTGASLIKIGELVKRQRHVKIRGAANPFDPQWGEYFVNRDKKQVQAKTAGLMARVHRAQEGTCPVCEQVTQYDEELVLHHRDGKRKNFKLANLVFYHPNCHQQRYYNEAR